MRRNVAGQYIGCQLISKTDGSPVTSGTTTVYVTGEAGTQVVGSVGSGACTHEGNGYWSYTPAQAETNYTQVAFTFVNSSACNATIQVFPLAYGSSGQFTAVELAATQTGVTIPTVTTLTNAPTGVTLAASQHVIVDSGTVTTLVNLPAAPTDWLTAAAVKADAVAKIQNGLATPTNISAGTITTVTNLSDKTGFSLTTTPPTAADISAAVWGSATRSLTTFGSLVADIATAVWGAATRTLSAFGFSVTASTVSDKTGYSLAATPPTAPEIANAVWDEAISGHVISGSTGNALSTASSGGVDPAVLADAIWDEALSGHTITGTTGKKLADLVNTDISALATSADVTTVDTIVGAIKVKTDQLNFIGTDIKATLDGETVVLGTSPPTAAQIRVELDTNSTKLANLDVAVSSRSILAAGAEMTLTGAYDAAKTAATQISVDAIPTSPLLHADYVPPDNAGIALIQTKTSQLTFVDAKVNANAVATVDTTAITNAILNEQLSNHTILGSVGAGISSAGGVGDPLATIVAGSDPPITRGEAIDALYIPEYVGPVTAIPAPSLPGIQTLVIIAKELGTDWAIGDIVQLFPVAGQQIGASVISTRPKQAIIGDNGVAQYNGVDGIPVDIGARLRVSVGNYYNKTITIDSNSVKNIIDY